MPTDGTRDDVLTGPNYRITPLTPRLVRLEWSPSGTFEDRPSVFATNRELSDDTAQVHPTETGLRIITEGYVLDYDRGPFSANGLSLAVRGGVTSWHSVWRYQQDLALPAHRMHQRRGDDHRPLDGNLGGATRTLDEANGAVDLDPGVNSANGYAVIDDSDSMVFDAEGRLTPRQAEPDSIDIYVFAAGRDHVAAVQDLFALSGAQPLLPRYALGNWWSRYHPYTAESYLELLDRFEQENLPFSVAVLDMDWHLTKVDPRYGSGWTGYTWNRELFPDPSAFQGELHERGLRVSLNVHPADGVRGFEEAYPAMCEALGRDADDSPIDFDVTDPAFMEAYLKVLHRGLEELGTDFWWVDWQQGPYSKVPGMDPLWVLNHEHFIDTLEQQGQGLVLSRYAGPGSHRYPVGFSGDTIITWESLAFQPRMTAAGANIGYGWWSHDIGGHMGGTWDPELATRWVQFGVFSPINRLHSTRSRFSSKEPWLFPEPSEHIMGEHLRLRHRLLPYLHAMNHRAHHQGRSIVEPTYFEQPCNDAYEYQDQYLFGSQLLVAPITAPLDPQSRRGSVHAFLPQGRWTDVFTGTSYEGGIVRTLHRDLESIPVLLRAGGFLPLVAPGESLDVRATWPDLEVMVAAGADGSFDLPEEVETGTWPSTHFHLSTERGEIVIDQPEGRPEGRESWILTLLGFDRDAFAEAGALSCEGAEITEVNVTADRVQVRLENAHAQRIVLRGMALTTTGTADLGQALEKLIQGAAVGYALKDRVFDMILEHGAGALVSLPAFGTVPTHLDPTAQGHATMPASLNAALVELVHAED